MNCVTVGVGLTERALGTLPARERAGIDRHLVWCAACRKEAAEIESAAAVFAFGVDQTEPDPALEASVVAAINHASGRRAPHTAPRRGRLAVVAVLAAMLAVSGLGWGAVMAGRAARSDEAALVTTLRQQSAAERFSRILSTAEFAGEGEVFLGTLGPSSEGGGGGSALTLVSPTITDMAVVLVNGVPPAERKHVPFTVWLRGPDGASMAAGRIDELDAAGSGIMWENIDRDLGVFDRVVVRDADGHAVMRGIIATRAPVSSPSP